jgi:hypothetical protein
MKFKNLRLMENTIMTKIMVEAGQADINPAGTISFMVSDLALLLVELHKELEELQHNYNIEEKDLLPLKSVLLRGESIPARVVEWATRRLK